MSPMKETRDRERQFTSQHLSMFALWMLRCHVPQRMSSEHILSEPSSLNLVSFHIVTRHECAFISCADAEDIFATAILEMQKPQVSYG